MHVRKMTSNFPRCGKKNCPSGIEPQRCVFAILESTIANRTNKLRNRRGQARSQYQANRLRPASGKSVETIRTLPNANLERPLRANRQEIIDHPNKSICCGPSPSPQTLRPRIPVSIPLRTRRCYGRIRTTYRIDFDCLYYVGVDDW